MKAMKLTIALSLVLVLSGTFALAKPAHHRARVRTYDPYRGMAQVRSAHPDTGNPDGSTVSAGGYLWNGRSASERGGD
jgi:hypothetical protein